MSVASFRLAAISVFVCGGWYVAAQVTGATITGEIVDASHSAVPKAEVTITNGATGLRRVVPSNEVGFYVVPQLPIGEYRIEVEAKGFKKSIREGVQTNVAQVVRVNFTLELGQITESVDVRAEAPGVATETTSLGNTRYALQIQSMPLDARGLTELYTLTPGVAVENYQATTGFSDKRGVGDVAYLMDGTAGNSPINGNSGDVPSLNGRTIEQDTPNLESIAEFQFVTANGKAEFDQISTVSVVTKSGTNELHGSVFEYNRVGLLSARSFFSPTRTGLTRNQYGFGLGGPVVVPKLYNGRNRSFFFMTYEGFRDNRAFPVTGKFPNSQERAGNLNELEAAGVQLRDPNGGAFPNDVIPASRISPTAAALLSYVPLPGGDVPSDTPAAYNFAGAKPQLDQTDKFDVKGDQRFGNADSLSVRVTHSINFNDWTNASPLPNQIGLGLQDTWATQGSLSETHIFSPTKINELRLGYWQKRRYVRTGGSQTDPLAGTPAAIPGITPQAPFQGLPWATISNSLIGVSSNLFGGATTSRKALEDTIQESDNFTVVYSRHTFKFGEDIRHPRINNLSVNNPAGNFSFSSSPSPAVSATGDSFADFLLGFPLSSAWQVPQSDYTRAMQYFFYAQDDFKISSRLTLNYGLRWDYYGRLGELYGRDANYELSIEKVVVPEQGEKFFLPNFVGNPLIVTSNTVGLGTRLLKPDYDDWGPRIGIAWQPFGNGKSVIRAAYGIYYNPYSGFLNFQDANSPPYSQSYSYSRSTAIGAGGTPPSFANPVATGGASSNLLAAVNSVDPNFKDLRAQVWNVTVQQQLAKSLVARVSYLKNNDTRLERQMYSNACLPGPIICDARTAAQFPRIDPLFPDTGGGLQSTGYSNYNALQAEVEKRYSNGLLLNANYTFGRLIGLTVDPAHPIGDSGLDRGLDPLSHKHLFHLNAVWELPLGPGKRLLNHGVPGRVAGGWQLSGLLHIQSGVPFSIYGPASNSGTGSDVNRANVTAGCNTTLSTGRPLNTQLNQWFNTSCFQSAPLGTVGDAGEGTLFGPRLFGSNLSLLKSFAIRERLKAQFRADFVNVFNHPEFGLPDNAVTDPSFGRISSTLGFPREIQFSLRLQF